MSRTIRLVKDGHEVHMPADWPSLKQFQDEGYEIVEEVEAHEETPAQTTLDLKAQVPPKPPVDTTDTRTTLEKAQEGPKKVI